jgi:hypothetical protein
VQRSYYVPVTCYQQKSYCEPVTTYQRSYYYEPVTSYRYSCYYDPCTCRYQQVACPVTCYQLRSQCNAVTSYLQRTCMVPVTTYRQACYYEPVTTCCTTTNGPAVSTLPPGATLVPGTQPGVTESRITPAPASPNPVPGVEEKRDYPPMQTNPPPMPSGADTSYRQPKIKSPAPPPPPAVKWERTVSLPGDANLRGTVVRLDHSGQAGARVLFVSADSDRPQQSTTADRDGRFQATLASGAWLVYTEDAKGTPHFQTRVEVPSKEQVRMTLVSR